MNKLTLLALVAVGSLAACASPSSQSSQPDSANSSADSDGDFEAQVLQGLHDSIQVDIVNMENALKDLQVAAPTPTGRGWDVVQDATALKAMKDAWIRARQAYERVEGVTAPIFPFIDVSIDERYDGFLATLGAAGDQNLFDNHGVTGMHAMERILYVNETPARIVQAESVIPGYKAAAFPGTEQEAKDFKNLLCAKAISDAELLRSQWVQAQFDPSSAFEGLTNLMSEQREKVNKAASGEEESRYSQRTMDDMRENLIGSKRAYELFAAWIKSKVAPSAGAQSGNDIHAQIEVGFTQLDQAYTSVDGTAIPQPPDTWSDDPSPADLATPFGKLYTLVRATVNPNTPTSVVAEMNSASSLLGFPQDQ